ncbi:hypothetical protein PAT3040_05417 [Paenibacillus agaridevorans]|uniref:Uncharacterized protein n=1 Tax=Paenibacillus agaridevorans TaxID=171404 RepID=A0A2R5EX03_9BACL|nr:hypothetical protein PAT3040_05417 [Paenibacillus agaridevorans]
MSFTSIIETVESNSFSLFDHNRIYKLENSETISHQYQSQRQPKPAAIVAIVGTKCARTGVKTGWIQGHSG